MKAKNKVISALGVCVGVALYMAAFQGMLYAQSVTIAPYKIILNAKGQFEDIQAIIRTPLESGYRIVDFEVNLRFNSVLIAQAQTLVYCYVDSNFLAGFNRTEVQNNPDVQAMAGSVVEAQVDGWALCVNAEGQTIVKELFGKAYVEILKPGK